MKKDSLILIALGLVIAWNVWLSLPKKEDDKVNYELFQEFYKQSKRRMADFDKQVIKINKQYEKDSIFIYNASDKQRDSLRSIYNPR